MMTMMTKMTMSYEGVGKDLLIAIPNNKVDTPRQYIKATKDTKLVLASAALSSWTYARKSLIGCHEAPICLILASSHQIHVVTLSLRF